MTGSLVGGIGGQKRDLYAFWQFDWASKQASQESWRAIRMFLNSAPLHPDGVVLFIFGFFFFPSLTLRNAFFFFFDDRFDSIRCWCLVWLCWAS
jgi:hypothetical protein